MARSGYGAPIGEYKEAVVLGPVHAAHHRGLVHDADLDGLENVVRACEALQPDDAVEVDMAALIEFVERLEHEVAGISLLERVVCGRRVFCHAGDAPDAEGDTEQGEHGLAEISQGLCGVGGVVVEHRHEDVRGPEAFRELDDDGELVDQEMVGGVDDHADEVEVILAGEVFVRVFVLVLSEGTSEGGAESGDPAVEGEQLLDCGEHRLLVHVGRFMA